MLFADEGTNAKGAKDFNDTQAQKMSDTKFDWLKGTLAKAKGSDHVFVFLHQPRWLKDAGNVRAVFAGHIHQMRSDGPRDGIEHITLATTGGHVPGYGEALGFLHHFDVVTVRKDGISLAAIPVGKTLYPREMSGKLIAETKQFGEQKIHPAPDIAVSATGAALGFVGTNIANPTGRPIEYTLTAGSEDSRWLFTPGHLSGSLAPGATATLKSQVSRVASPTDETFRDPVLTLEAAYLMPGYRYPTPSRLIAIPVAFDPAVRAAIPNRALRCDRKEARLYLDGRLVASAARAGIRKRNDLPLVIGGDVDGAGTATSHFAGRIDHVRVSTVPRYQRSRVDVPERPEADAKTCLLLNMDQITGLKLIDASASKAHAERCAHPSLVPVN